VGVLPISSTLTNGTSTLISDWYDAAEPQTVGGDWPKVLGAALDTVFAVLVELLLPRRGLRPRTTRAVKPVGLVDV
jgi:hypothetical protein